MTASPNTFQGLNTLLEGQNSIARRCQYVERCLEINRDNPRGFFESCFSVLLRLAFGLGASGSSWFKTASAGSSEDANALVALFSPTGKLFQAIHAADNDALIQFSFPPGRLPTHTQQLLCLEPGRKALEKWPQYRGHLKPDPRDPGKCAVHLNILEYFIFWTAFYVLKGSQVTSDYNPDSPAKGLQNFSSNIQAFSKAFGVNKGRGQSSRSPYQRLLRHYLIHFLPQNPASYTPRGPQSPSRRRTADAAHASNGRLLISVLLEFWLTDGDLPLPLPPTPQGSPDLLAAFNTSRVRSYQAPSDDLIQALKILTRHILTVDATENSPSSPAQATSWLPAIPADAHMQQQARASAVASAPSRLGGHVSAPAQAFSRRLYRFLRRALLHWPENLHLRPILELWLAVLIPWQEEGVDMRRWEGHVLANLPFYTRLLPLFLDLLRTRVSTRGDQALADLIRVMRPLQAAPSLLKLVEVVESDLARFTGQAGRRPDGPHADVLPFLVTQGQDWEAYASSSQSSASTKGTEEVSLFGSSEASASAKARDLLGAAAGAAKPEALQEAQALVRGVLPLHALPESHSHSAPLPSRPLPPIKGLKLGSWQDVRYKGDWMRRPLSSSEIGWLVRLLLYVSDIFNAWFHLDQPPAPEATPTLSLEGLSIWLRKKGWKINLRPLGEKQLLAWLLICSFFIWCIIKLFGLAR